MEIKLTVQLSLDEVQVAVENYLVTKGMKPIEFIWHHYAKSIPGSTHVVQVEAECQSLKK